MSGSEDGSGGGSPADPDGARTSVRERVTDALRQALILGQIQPGRPVTLRGLADRLGTSAMPVREAIRGLAAEKALEVSPAGRVAVPRLTPQRFLEILEARALLEPKAALLALPHLTRDVIRRLEALDDRVDACLTNGDVEGYMSANHAFHFTIYRESRSDVFLPLIESVWLRCGPLMRLIYGRVGTAGLLDHHKSAIRAASAGDADGLAEAIRLDIAEGMSLIGEALKVEETTLAPLRRRPRKAVA